MRLQNIRHVGRYTNPKTGNNVNVKRGFEVSSGRKYYFYLNRGTRHFISDHEFSSWKLVTLGYCDGAPL